MALQQWPGERFARALKAELEALPAGSLPLAAANGGYVDDSAITATVLRIEPGAESLEARVGIFFTEIIANCGCGEDPMPVPAYCALRVSIDRESAAAEFEVLP